jgi:ferredoxin|tara:strand:- start:13313 stop:13642 length:330 start_codon:yes stop_codon:yes gene_type:complete
MKSKGFQMTIEGSDKVITCQENETILSSLERQRFAKIPVGCRKGGCGVCKIKVTQGEYEAGKMSKAHMPESEKGLNCTLACKTYPRSNMKFKIVHPKPQVFDFDTLGIE